MRRFPDWLKAYLSYAKDNYCPDSFHLWTGISVLSGALERKVWLKNGKITYFPNLFVMLVTYAGVGKSTALVRGTDLLERIKQEIDGDFKIVDEKITDAAFVKLMSVMQSMTFGTTILHHTTGYFYASEASASALQDTHGKFTATITGFYDCPKVFRKTTITGGADEYYNVCFSMLAGATFDYLRTLVNDTSVMGGFASRIIYVVSRDRLIREPKWAESDREEREMQEKLFADLVEIHKMIGPMKPTRAFIEAWEKFQPESDRHLAALNSPRLESLAARRSNHITKVAMILSISESDSLVLEARHWEQAQELVDEVMKDNSYILAQGAMADKTSQLGVTQILGQILKKAGGKMPVAALKGTALTSGFPIDALTKTVDYMLGAQWIRITQDGSVELLVDPERYL